MPNPSNPTKKNPHAVALGRRGGRKGGPARARNLTPEQLSIIGKRGAQARWGSFPALREASPESAIATDPDTPPIGSPAVEDSPIPQ